MRKVRLVHGIDELRHRGTVDHVDVVLVVGGLAAREHHAHLRNAGGRVKDQAAGRAVLVLDYAVLDLNGAPCLHKRNAIEALRLVEHVGEHDARLRRGAHHVDGAVCENDLAELGRRLLDGAVGVSGGASSKIQILRSSCLHVSITKRRSRHQPLPQKSGCGRLSRQTSWISAPAIFSRYSTMVCWLSPFIHKNGSTWLS